MITLASSELALPTISSRGLPNKATACVSETPPWRSSSTYSASMPSASSKMADWSMVHPGSRGTTWSRWILDRFFPARNTAIFRASLEAWLKSIASKIFSIFLIYFLLFNQGKQKSGKAE
jgi:hypothetical protein